MKVILCVYCLIIVFVFIQTMVDLSRGNEYNWTPSDFYDQFNVNWAGAVILFLFHLLLNPLTFVVLFIKWIFTVGRTERN